MTNKQQLELPENFELDDLPVKTLVRLAYLFRRGLKMEDGQVVAVALKSLSDGLPVIDDGIVDRG